MPRPIYVLGTSGFAREMATLVSQIDPAHERWEIAGFIGESEAQVGTSIGRYRVCGTDDWLIASDVEADLVVGIGHPAIRAALLSRYRPLLGRLAFPTLVHPTAVIDASITMGLGTVVTAHCSLTCDIAIGDFTLLNLNCTVGHESTIGSCCVVNPGVNVSGGVKIGDRVLVGTGAQLLGGLEIGAGATVGAGAVVTVNVPRDLTVVGVPARPIKGRVT